MSTRSGKRIRGSDNENIVNTDEENVVKSERKSRSKRLKMNCGEVNISLQKTKRRDNYVTYPTDDEVVESDATVTTENSDKPSKNSRKNVLKEQDINVTMQSHIDNFDSDIDTKKPIRVTRRTRKFTENNAEETTVNEVINDVTNGKIKESKKKDKHKIIEKESGKVPKSISKKSKKQKKKNVKRTSLIIVEDIQPEKSILNKSNTDRDSFHSAAGSPDNGENIIQNTPMLVIWPEVSPKINTTFEKDIGNSKSIKSSKLTTEAIETPQNRLEKLTIINNSMNQSSGKGNRKKKGLVIDLDGLNVTSDMASEINNVSYDKVDHNNFVKPDKLNTTFEKQHENEKSQYTTSSPSKNIPSTSLNGTFETTRVSEIKSIDTTYEKEDIINTTFDNTETQNHNSGAGKLSLISLDSSEGAVNTTYHKSVENSQRSNTNDELMTVNLINTTPVLIESSIDSLISNDTSKLSRTPSPKNSVQTVPTPLRREGTFTKDEPAVEIDIVKTKVSIEKTPTKQILVASPGCTPFHSAWQTKQEKKSILNITHSIEKPARRSSVAELPPRMTKVMFCSPLNNPTIGTDKKMKEIKSSLKGSNKSFVFEFKESPPAMGRKRSRTQGDTETAAAKRKRLASGTRQDAVDRLARPRTSSANAKLVQSTTPSKKTMTPSKPKTADNRPARSKLPNFAALHQRQFQKMESLDECQERKAKRAKQLLTPLGSLAVLEKSSPKSPAADTSRIENNITKKIDTPMRTIHPINTKKTTATITTDPIKPGYTRFGFKLNLDINPFSIPSKTREVQKPIGGLIRERTLPSLTGVTSSRKEIAKQTIMREKSFTSLSDKRNMKRKENRTIIKGVRTNRRFELQMKMRNGDS